MSDSAQHNLKTFAVIKPDLTMALAPTGPTLYPDLDRDFDQFRGHMLISTHVFQTDWTQWESHPSGDEFVTLLDGEMTLILREGAQDRSVVLREAGQFVVVPRGVWHTAKTRTGATAMFVTPGEGTRNAERPPAT